MAIDNPTIALNVAIGFGVALLVLPIVAAISRLVKAASAGTSAYTFNKKDNSVPTTKRRTDIEEHLDNEGRRKRAHAEELVKAGDILSAAQLLESINFQRRAIDLLEEAGEIHAACAILLRLNAPLRAATFFEKHGYIREAADHFRANGKGSKAAELYRTVARTNFEYYRRAVEAAREGEDTALVRSILMEAMDLKGLKEYALEHGDWDTLLESMADSGVAYAVVRDLDQDQIRTFADGITMTPRHIRILVAQVLLCPLPAFKSRIIERVTQNRYWLRNFWQQLGSRNRAALLAEMYRDLAPTHGTCLIQHSAMLCLLGAGELVIKECQNSQVIASIIEHLLLDFASDDVVTAMQALGVLNPEQRFTQDSLKDRDAVKAIANQLATELLPQCSKAS